MNPSPPVSSRHIAIDLARVFAIWFMIQGHTLDVLLAPALRQGFVFNKWLFLRGLTAPTFFLLSGISFTLASIRRWDSYLTPSQALFRRLGRFVFFILLGYLMHLPAHSWRDFAGLGAAGWQSGFQVDVLQCIGLTLAFLQILILITKTPARFAKFALAAAAFVVLLTPVMWSANFASWVPGPVAAYFNGLSGSLFPLFPWAGYVLLGAAVGHFVAQRRLITGNLPTRELAAGGALLLLAGTCFQNLPFHIYQNADYWLTSPNLFFLRVGCVGLIVALLACVVRWIWLPQGAIRSLAQESLTIYFVHICILYGSLWNAGLRQRIGETLTIGPTLAWIALMLVSMTLLGLAWNWFKHTEPKRIYFVRAALAAAVVYSLM
jgi:uncharacterized membrane protein